jgi:hypothetical protein
MSHRYLGFALAMGLGVASASGACSKGGNSGTISTTGVGGSGGMIGTGGSDPTVAQCAKCLDQKCATEKANCDADCYAIQGCIDAICFHLSELGSTDEGTCQVYCQSLHPNGKLTHIAYVTCAQDEPMPMDMDGGSMGPPATCVPPCAFYDYDYKQCVAEQSGVPQSNGGCKEAVDACNASSDCKTYVACASTCPNFMACQMCGSGPSGSAGEQLYEAEQRCLDTQCFAQGWLPHF